MPIKKTRDTHACISRNKYATHYKNNTTALEKNCKLLKTKGNPMKHMPETPQTKYSIQDFLPLIIIGAIIVALTTIHQLYYGFNFMQAMRIFMAFFFLVFGFFKVINLKNFAHAYAKYDVIAQQFFGYGYVYPFLEIGLGIAYLTNWMPLYTNIFTLIIMLIGAYGIFVELRKGREIVCACLGTVFKLPMTWVTLSEDLLMALMALIMLIM